MPNGKVLAYGSVGRKTTNDGRAIVFWDVDKGYGKDAITSIQNAQGTDSFCSTANWLSNGQ